MKPFHLLLGIFYLMLTLPALADDYSATMNDYKANPVASRYFNSAYGYAVFPTIGKGGFGIGGAHGKGQVYRGGELVGKTSMTQVSIGLQLGGQAYSQIIFFEDARAFKDFASGNFEFSAGANAIAITASANASVSTTGITAGAGIDQDTHASAVAGYHKGMAIVQMGKGGLMYEASLAGQKYSYTPL